MEITLLNKIFITKYNKELYIGVNLKNEVIEYYKELYKSDIKRKALQRNLLIEKKISKRFN